MTRYDARTGKEIWKYNLKVPSEWAVNVCCGLVNRGIAAYNGKIYVARSMDVWSRSMRGRARKRGP